MSRLILQSGKEKSLQRRHPWVFSGAIQQVVGDLSPGDSVDVHAADGRFLARAAWSPQSRIRARVWTWDMWETVDADFFGRRVARAVALRKALLPAPAGDARRLVHGESDGLPGVVVDQYGDMLVTQFSSTGAERWREEIVAALVAESGCRRVYERSDAEVRTLEGMTPRTGPILGDAPDGPVPLTESGLQYLADVVGGHKTGFYLDQRDNRALVRQLAKGRDVLNCFSYTGAFSVAALAGGAKSVLSLDSSGPALELGRQHLALNGLADAPAEWLEADAFKALRTLRDAARRFDLIVLDPPKFAPTAAHAEKAARAYKDANLQALRLLRPDGLLVTFSCSGGVNADLFQKIVAGAAVDAGVEAQIIHRLGPGLDHPTGIHFPEGAYLKGLVLRVL